MAEVESWWGSYGLFVRYSWAFVSQSSLLLLLYGGLPTMLKAAGYLLELEFDGEGFSKVKETKVQRGEFTRDIQAFMY